VEEGPLFEIAQRRVDGRLVVAPAGDLDIAVVDRMRGVLAERAPGEALELDLTRLEFLDTSGLQLIVETHRDARREGFPLTLVRGAPAVHRVFEIAGLDRVLPFADAAG
jgi:anti-sigma B factor antagonist